MDMAGRTKPDEWIRWAVWLAAGAALWLAGALLASSLLDKWPGEPGRRECAVSCAYIAVLFVVMAIGTFARVRTLLTLEILYGIGVLARAAVGTVCALLFLDLEQTNAWVTRLDVLVRPLRGLEYVAAQLTAHFITEIYWLGLGLSATILVFLACVARMAASSRIARARESAGRSRAAAPASARRETAAGRRRK